MHSVCFDKLGGHYNQDTQVCVMSDFSKCQKIKDLKNIDSEHPDYNLAQIINNFSLDCIGDCSVCALEMIPQKQNKSSTTNKQNVVTRPFASEKDQVCNILGGTMIDNECIITDNELCTIYNDYATSTSKSQRQMALKVQFKCKDEICDSCSFIPVDQDNIIESKGCRLIGGVQLDKERCGIYNPQVCNAVFNTPTTDITYGATMKAVEFECMDEQCDVCSFNTSDKFVDLISKNPILREGDPADETQDDAPDETQDNTM